MMRQAVRLNSLSEVALTKLDVLDTLRHGQGVRRLRGRTASASPTRRTTRPCSTRSPPSTRSCPGGGPTSRAATEIGDLPQAARDYVALPGRADRGADPAGRGGPGPRAVRPLRRMSGGPPRHRAPHPGRTHRLRRRLRAGVSTRWPWRSARTADVVVTPGNPGIPGRPPEGHSHLQHRHPGRGDRRRPLRHRARGAPGRRPGRPAAGRRASWSSAPVPTGPGSRGRRRS